MVSVAVLQKRKRMIGCKNVEIRARPLKLWKEVVERDMESFI